MSIADPRWMEGDSFALGTDEQDDDQPFLPDDSNGYDTLDEFYDFQD